MLTNRLTIAIIGSLVCEVIGCAPRPVLASRPGLAYQIKVVENATPRRTPAEVIVYRNDLPSQPYRIVANLYTETPLWLIENSECVSSDGTNMQEPAQQQAAELAARLGGDAVIVNNHAVADVSDSHPYRALCEIRVAVVRFEDR